MEEHEWPAEIIPVYCLTHVVSKDDIDVLNHANNVCYVHWMQDVALAHSAALGWPTERYTTLGSTWVARRHTIDYLHQAFLGDELLVQTWVSEMKNVSSVRRYQFTRKSDNVIVAAAQTRWGFVSMATGRPTRLPREMQQTFQLSLEMAAKLDLTKNFKFN
ncbi:MAG: thioesterase family protein [Planctomycetia bacterium]|nr:thioesterase family protein [Planctomycetia bacterium]